MEVSYVGEMEDGEFFLDGFAEGTADCRGLGLVEGSRVDLAGGSCEEEAAVGGGIVVSSRRGGGRGCTVCDRRFRLYCGTR